MSYQGSGYYYVQMPDGSVQAVPSASYYPPSTNGDGTNQDQSVYATDPSPGTDYYSWAAWAARQRWALSTGQGVNSSYSQSQMAPSNVSNVLEFSNDRR